MNNLLSIAKLYVMKAWLLGAALLITGTGFAQMKSNSNDYLPMSTIGVGIGFQDFDGLNSRIAGEPAYRSLKDYTGIVHLGWLKERNRLVSQGNLTLGSSMSGDRNRQSSTTRFIGIGADIGYDVLAQERIMLYPFAGIGYEWYQAKFFRDVSNIDFDDVLESPILQNGISPIRFNNSFFTYKVGLGVNLFAPKERGASVGLQAAYTGSFQDREWRSKDGQDLRNAPEDRLGRFQISLILTHSPMREGKRGR